MKVVDAVANILKDEDVRYLFAYPFNPLIEGAAKVGIRPIIVRQERTGVHMADAVSRVTSGDEIGVFCMQKGPGSENAYPGVAQAFADSVPIVIFPMGFDRHSTKLPPNYDPSMSYQTITKSAERVEAPEAVLGAVRRAFNQVRNGRPQPTLVQIPRDLFDEELPSEYSYERTSTHRSSPDPTAIPAICDELLAAEHPVIYAGQGVHYAQAWDELREFAELIEAPVMTSLQGKSAFPETHPLSIGSGGVTAPGTVPHFLETADLIFGIGCSFTETPFGVTMPDENLIIHCTLDPSDINKDVKADYALIGDAKLSLSALHDELKESLDGSPRDRWETLVGEIEAVRKDWLDEWDPYLSSEEVPLSPFRVIHDLQQTVDVENTIITHDAGSPRDELSPFWNSIEPLTYLGWGKTTQLGYGLGLAMGAKLARPDKLCINVWGDAAIGMTGMDLETAVREEIPILSILLNNFSMAMEIPHLPVSTEKYGSTNITGHYANMMEAFGGYGERIREPDGIVPAIERGIAKTEEGTPALLEFITTTEKASPRVDLQSS